MLSNPRTPLRSALVAVAAWAALAVPARASDVVPLDLGGGEFLFAATFPESADYVCFRPDGFRASCTLEPIPVSEGAFRWGPRRFSGFPSGTHAVAVRQLRLQPGLRISAFAGKRAHSEAALESGFSLEPPVPFGPAPVPFTPIEFPGQPASVQPASAQPASAQPASAGPASAKPDPAADPTPDVSALPRGISRCEEIRRTQRGILFCEDFENPAYNRAGRLTRGHAWYRRFGYATPDKNCEGPSAPCIIDVVAAGQCNAKGETARSCIFDGKQSLGFAYHDGSDGGNLGEFRFSSVPLRSFGISYAMRMSPGLEFRDAAKFDRVFGPQRDVTGAVHHLLGSNTNEGFVRRAGLFASAPRNPPFQAGIQVDHCEQATDRGKKSCSDVADAVVRAGAFGENSEHLIAQPDPSAYNFPSRAPGGGPARGEWLCMQFHVTGFGTRDAHLRWWVNGELVIDVDHADLSRVRGLDKRGLYGVRLENYTNGGYHGEAYRYEDNWVVSSAAEPVSCQAIGFPAQAKTRQVATPPRGRAH